uniref:Carboxypeptidase Q n=1 Tax=Plectus sambesii TaxID=2011161 RepID=A0A914WQP7_9BILA
MFVQRAVALVAVLCSAKAHINDAEQKAVNDDSRFVQPLPDWIEPFENHTKALFTYITAGEGRGVAFDWLAELVDTFGHRHLGTAALEDAIDFTVERLKADGFDNVHTEDVPDLPHWERGDDLAELIEPRRHKLNILAVDGSPSADVTAEAIVVQSFDELNAKAKSGKVEGKIVVFLEKWSGYTQTVKYRGSAAIVEKAGGVGVLIKSIGTFSLYSPHTGSGARGANVPAACITTEEAEMMYRMQERGNKLVIHLNFTSREVGTVTSRNTVFEITGSEKPKEIVLLSGHMDSWDVGQGALDDGGGCAAVWHALLVLKKFGVRPKRTIRVVLWTAEEQGLLGAKAYHKAHNDSDETFFFVSETDQGAFRPKSWSSHLTFSGTTEQMKTYDDIVLLINSFGVPLSIEPKAEQGDVTFWAKEGVPASNYITEQGRDYYFYFHHTDADYMTIFKDGDLEFTSAMYATLAHVIANMDSW